MAVTSAESSEQRDKPSGRTATIDAALAAARQRYIDRRPASAAAHAEASRHLPGGNTRTVLWFSPFPFRARRGWDAMIEDVDGHEYVDLLGEYTAGLFGHSNPIIRQAISGVVEDGLSFGAHNLYEARLAAAICERFASIDLVRFTNSGTEANLMAIALARVDTGRPALLAFDGAYHGGFLSFAHGPSPVNVPYDVVLGTYNDVSGTAKLIEANRNRLAAVIVEPMLGSGGCLPASDELLGVLRDACSRGGIVLIFDEVMTSRLAPGGAQARYGVTPDLTTLGKYLGGGASFGAFGGRRDLMARFDPSQPGALGHAGTFNNNVLSMAAGLAGLTGVLTPETIVALNERGDRLRHELNVTFTRRRASFVATGIGSMMTIHPVALAPHAPGDLADADDRLRELLFLELLDAGYYLARRGFIALSIAVTDEQIEGFVDAVDRVLAQHGELVAAAG